MKRSCIRMLPLLVAPLLLWGCAAQQTASKPDAAFQFVYTSDPHYGITRAAFQGGKNIDAHSVNVAMVSHINELPTLKMPCDGGVKACAPVGAIDFVVQTGDIANRMEGGVQSAADSWQQFATDYLQILSLTDSAGQASKVYLLPGNHDVTNAVGFYKPMTLQHDATSMAEIYNRMLKPAVPKTRETYNYAIDKVNYAQDINGVHFAFINMWPDSQGRAWLENDLKTVADTTPVVIFTHDQPEVEAKHFINPNGKHDINPTDKFENLLSDALADKDREGKLSIKANTEIEQRAFARFIKAHRNVVAYFHGNENANEYYVWQGPDKDVALNVFRVDSPMKGDVSAKDESKLSFQLVAVDPQARKMTVREYRWNTDSAKAWGDAITVSLQPR